VKCGWSMAGLIFKHQFKFASMEARTDGYLGLQSDAGQEAFAIIETKAHHRTLTLTYRVITCTPYRGQIPNPNILRLAWANLVG
jgi:hypothetical protein